MLFSSNSTRKDDFLDLCPIKSSFKHDLFYSKSHPPSREMSPEKKSPCCHTLYKTWVWKQDKEISMMLRCKHYSDLFLKVRLLNSGRTITDNHFRCHSSLFFLPFRGPQRMEGSFGYNTNTHCYVNQKVSLHQIAPILTSLPVKQTIDFH